jgi:outer membrane lipoprotein carrier protein
MIISRSIRTGARQAPRWIAVWAVGVALAATTPVVSETSLDTAAVVSGLNEWLHGTLELECRFEQTLVSGAFGAGLRESGRLYLKRPGRIRWEYTKPEEKLAIVRDGEALLYLPEDQQLIRGGEEWSQSLLAELLGGDRQLDELFEATLVATPEHGGNGDYRLRLVPRGLDDGFQEVTLDLRPPTFSIERAEVLDEAGNRMRYRFRSHRRNRGVADELFVFVPPPGTEILDPS